MLLSKKVSLIHLIHVKLVAMVTAVLEINQCLTKVLLLSSLCMFGEGFTKPAQASKKQQKKQSLSIYSGLGVYRLQNFGGFVFFDACAGFVKIMLCFFSFFDAGACFVKVCRD